MTDYTKTVNFAAKDALATGNPAKSAKGTEVDTELNNIATAIATKFDSGDTVAVADGSALLPGLVFASDLDTGLYHIGANNFGISVNGGIIVNFSAGLTQIGNVLGVADGTAAAPGAAFATDLDTGLFHDTANQIGFAAGGAKVGSLSSQQILLPDGVVGAPAVSFLTDPDTGFYRLTSNFINFSFGGVDQGVVTGRSAGSFTGTITGTLGATTGTFYYNRTGLLVNVFTIAAITGTSNSVDMTITGLPAAIQPANNVRTTCVVVDNNGDCLAETNISGGTIGLRSSFVSGTKVLFADSVFTSSGTKGVPIGFSLTYSMG